MILVKLEMRFAGLQNVSKLTIKGDDEKFSVDFWVRKKISFEIED